MQKLSLYEHGVRAMVYADSPEKQRRVVEENQARPLLPKAAMNSLYGIIYKYPDATKKVLAAPYRMKGMDVIAFGRNSTVIQKDDSVIKIARSSEHMSHEQRGKLIDELSFRHTTLKRYLGAACLNQTFQEIPHPLRKTPIVAAIQPFVQFEAYTNTKTYDDIRQSMLVEFAQLSEDMDNETGLVNDVSGTNNFGFDANNNLVVVDTIPLKASDGGPSIDYARRIITNLANYEQAKKSSM